jgi:hypothetical protein
MRSLAKWLGAVAAGLIVVSGGISSASADPAPPHAAFLQRAHNDNATSQEARSEATTKQANVNLPIALFTVGSNDGDVSQHNAAQTESESSNSNHTGQLIGQLAPVVPTAPAAWKGDKTFGGQDGSNVNRTEQEATSFAETKQLNLNAPISAFSVGSNNGDVDQHNKALTESKAKNHNRTGQAVGQKTEGHHTKSCGCEHESPQPEHHDCGCSQGTPVDQQATNGNETDQSASSQASTKQANVNLPIALFSVGSNNGDVQQGNEAQTSAESSNQNGTLQAIGQWAPTGPSDSSCGCHDGHDGHDATSQDGSNSSSTGQDATSQATTKQLNVNAPIALFSVGSNNGNVDQGNQAGTQASSSNGNATGQLIGQVAGVGGLLGG